MKVLVFGHSGQVASHLRDLCDPQFDITTLDRVAADLTDPDACARQITDRKPDAVINAAAYTAVDKAEAEEHIADLINAQAPAAMARACQALGIPLVSISTDYVFSGSGYAAWKPSDDTDPQNAYGRTKTTGEIAIAQSGATYGVLRTSWVFSAYGNNFVKTMLRLRADRDTLTVVADQVGGPTHAKDIALACLTMAEQLARAPEKSGIYHFSGYPDTNWADFARAIFEEAKLDCSVTDIPSKDYPTPAGRPLNSRMDCADITRAFGIQRPDWRPALSDILQDLKL